MTRRCKRRPARVTHTHLKVHHAVAVPVHAVKQDLQVLLGQVQVVVLDALGQLLVREGRLDRESEEERVRNRERLRNREREYEREIER